MYFDWRNGHKGLSSVDKVTNIHKINIMKHVAEGCAQTKFQQKYFHFLQFDFQQKVFFLLFVRYFMKEKLIILM